MARADDKLLYEVRLSKANDMRFVEDAYRAEAVQQQLCSMKTAQGGKTKPVVVRAASTQTNVNYWATNMEQLIRLDRELDA